MKAIVVVDKNWGIGKEEKLLTHLSGDLKYFREKTLGKTVVMGRKTFEGLPGILSGRETIVLSKDTEYKPECKVCYSVDELMDMLSCRDEEDIFIAGGEQIYRQMMPYCDKFLVTKIQEAFDADRFFPNLDAKPDEFETVWESDIEEENGVRYQFTEYRRKLRG